MVLVVAAGAARASEVSSGGSESYGLRADIRAVVGLVKLDTGRVSHAMGQAPAPYDMTRTTASLDASALGVATLSTDALEAHAMSDLSVGDTSGFAESSSLVDDLMLRVAPGLLLNPDLVRITAGTVTSRASLMYDGSDVVPLGEVFIESAGLKVAGVPIPVQARPLPNTVIFNALGVRIVLNEQHLTEVDDTTTLVVNAIRITVDGALQIVDADVVIGNSSATLTVPDCLFAGCPADLNEDCLVDFPDYLEFLNYYDEQNLRVDFVPDGMIDFTDYLEFLNHYDAGC